MLWRLNRLQKAAASSGYVEVIKRQRLSRGIGACDGRQYVARQLAEQLRPELEAALKRTDSAPGEAYSPDAASVRPASPQHCSDSSRDAVLVCRRLSCAQTLHFAAHDLTLHLPCALQRTAHLWIGD